MPASTITLSGSRLLFLLAAVIALAPLAIDMYLPALPAIEKHFSAATGEIQATVAAYFLGLAVGQLFYGPLSDRFGRRRPLLAGLMLFSVASLGCALAPSAEVLIGLRLLQALGGCAGMVVVRAVVRDRYPPQEMARTLSRLLLVMGVAPILAPLAGSLLLLSLDWRGIFLVLALYGVVLSFCIARLLPETLLEPGPDKTLKQVAESYLRLIRHRRFMGYAISGGFAQSGLFVYIASSAFVFIDGQGLTPTQFAVLFGLNAAGFILASQINAWLVMRVPSERIIRTALNIYLSASLVLLVNASTGFGGLWGLILPLFVSVSILGFGFPNTTAAALAPFGDRAGLASALLGTLQFSFAGVASAIAGVLQDGSPLPMAAVIAACGLIANLALRILVRRSVQ